MVRVCVLFGGASSEYEVSLCSAASVLKNIDRTKYTVLPVGITRDGGWYYYKSDDIDAIEADKWCTPETCVKACISPDRTVHGLVTEDGEKISIDCVFPVLHGACGEDGSMQGLLELAAIPYVGCGIAASANGMDKTITKIFVDRLGIRQAKWISYTDEEFFSDSENICRHIVDSLGLPLFVKAASTGSSVGVSKAKSLQDVLDGATLALKYGKKVLFEEAIVGREVEVAVLGGGKNTVASVCGEVSPVQEFYTYDAKYNDDASELYIPARISEPVSLEVRESAVRIFRALDGFGLSRVDFFVEENGGVVFNEINTIPGFTKISMYPKLFSASGIPYGELIDRLIALSFTR